MIYIGENEISGIYLGDSEITGIYCGELQLYPTNLGTLTGIAIENLTWVTDIAASGGTATSVNCSFNVYAYYDSGKRKKVNNQATVTGSLVVPATTAETREMVGTLTLTASYSGFTDSDTVDVYQKALTYNYIITYTTTDSNILNFSTTGWMQNIVSHTNGRIEFDDDVTMIPDNAFSGCSTLQTISIPSTVTSYGSNAFNHCSGMTEFTIGSNVNSIGEGCFYYASGELTIDSQYACTGTGSSGQSYVDNWIYSFNYRFCQRNNISNRSNYFTKVIITADTVTWIGQSAFNGCFNNYNSVTELYIGNYVTVFGGMAFRSPNALKKITVGTGIQTIGNYCFFAGLENLDEMYWYKLNAPTLYGGVSQTFQYAKNQSTCTFHYPVNGTGYTSWKTSYLSNWTFVNDL